MLCRSIDNITYKDRIMIAYQEKVGKLFDKLGEEWIINDSEYPNFAGTFSKFCENKQKREQVKEYIILIGYRAIIRFNINNCGELKPNK